MTGLSLPNGITSTYQYDDAGRLNLLTHNTLTDTLATYDYLLDDVGNRRTLTETLLAVQPVTVETYAESNGSVVMEAENDEITNGATHNWLRLTAQSGYTGTSYLQTSLDIDALYQTNELTTTSPVAEYAVNFTTPGAYTVWLRGYPPNAAGDSVYVGVDDEVVTVTGFAPGEWSWANLSLSGQERSPSRSRRAGCIRSVCGCAKMGCGLIACS